jgi:hypothetical protein
MLMQVVHGLLSFSRPMLQKFHPQTFYKMNNITFGHNLQTIFVTKWTQWSLKPKGENP